MTKLIAELSMNHMGDMELAKDMIVAAHESGADYVKFQTWKTKNLKAGPWDNDGRREIYAKAELTEEKHEILFSFCDEIGVKFLSSCFAKDDLDVVRKFSSEVKIPSPECSNAPLVLSAIEKFETVYISTGASKSPDWDQYCCHDNVCLLHCVSVYPCPPDKANLLRINTLKHWNRRAGYSGHCIGIWDAIAAISMGAEVIEKHFTINQNLPFRDNKFAILPEDLALIRNFADELPKLEVDHGLDFQPEEQDVRDQYARRWEV